MSLDSLRAEIQAGRVVAIMRDGAPWLSPGEVARVRNKRAAETASPPAPVVEPAAPLHSSEVAGQAMPEPPAEPRRQDQELLKRYEQVARQLGELEKVNQRLKLGLQETEATLRKSRTAKSNLESDIINLQEQLKRAQTRSVALEREVQHLTHQIERAEERHSSEMRKMRSHDRGQEAFSTNSGTQSSYSLEEVMVLRQQMEEKDRIISQEYQERAVLRSQLEERSQKFFELKARYEKEKAEWSEILARELQTHGLLKSQLEELRPKGQKGWNPFRREK